LGLALPIKEANKGLACANSFLLKTLSSALPGFGALVAFFMRRATANHLFLKRSVFFIAMAVALEVY